MMCCPLANFAIKRELNFISMAQEYSNLLRAMARVSTSLRDPFTPFIPHIEYYKGSSAVSCLSNAHGLEKDQVLYLA
jgi:hypothetical protein